MSIEQLILTYQDRIYNVILKMCGNADDAAELTQETFVKVIENIDGFKEKCSLYTWTFRMALNLTLNHRKRFSKFKFLSLDTPNGQELLPLREFMTDGSTMDPALVAQNREECEIIIKLLLKMDKTQRAVIVLRDIEGMNYAQIGRTLNIKLGTVKSKLARARGVLREILEFLCQPERAKTLIAAG